MYEDHPAALNTAQQKERTILNDAAFIQAQSKIHSLLSMILVRTKPHYLKRGTGETNPTKSCES